MKVLVTGGAGYVGSHAVRELLSAGHDVVIYDNLSTGHREFAAGLPLIVGDIGDYQLVMRSLDGVDAVMHFAASAYVGESIKNPRKYFQNNVESALVLLDAILASHVRFFVFSSTCAVYGTPHHLPIAESFPREPINPYGVSKLFLEHVLSAYRESHGLRSVCLRYFNAAGAHIAGDIGEFHDPEPHLIPLAMRAALGTAAPLVIFGNDLPTDDGTCIRDYIHVTDLGVAHVKGLDHLVRGGQSISVNLGTGKGTSIGSLLAALKKVAGREVPYQFGPRRQGDPPALFADGTMAAKILQWTPQFDLESILRTAWAWETEGLPRLLSSTLRRA